jgi:tetratricopeptide (TPR) repeat protein
LKQLSQFTALRLFTERARAVQPEFELNDENVQTVTLICTRLDGLPLAIELIAARVRVMSVQYLFSQMSEQFILSADGMRSIPARQKTLQNAIGWSYNFLTDKEQILFRRLAVFAGGWTLSEAQAVCADEYLEADQIPYILAHLVDKSLVVQQEWAGMMRYKMLMTIHQFAHEKLLEAGENELTRKQHLVCFVKLIEQAEPELFHSDQAKWLNQLDDELGNLRMAMEWALTNDIEAGLRIAAIPWQFWEPRGHSHELGNWLAQFLERYITPNSLRAHALVVYSQLIAQQGSLSHAHTIANQSLQLSRAISDEKSEAFSLRGLGMIVALQGDLRGAIPIVEQSLTLYQLLGDKLGQAIVKGWLCLNNKDQEQSKVHIMESLGLYRELGHLSGIALCLSELAHRTIWEGNFSSPSQWLEEARMIYLQLGDQSGEAEVLYYYGNLAYWTGEYQQACAYYREAIELLGRAGIYLYAFWPRVDLAYAIFRQGNISEAREIFRYCAQEFQKQTT